MTANSDLHLVADVRDLLPARSLHAVGRVRIVWILNPLAVQFTLSPGPQRLVCFQDKLLTKHVDQLLDVFPLHEAVLLPYPGNQCLGIVAGFQQLVDEHFVAGAVVELVLHVTLPPRQPCGRTLRRGHCRRDFLQGHPQRFSHAFHAAHATDEAQHMGGVHPLIGTAFDQSGIDESLEDRLESDGGQVVFLESVTKAGEGSGMEEWITQLTVEREVPAGVITKHVDGLTIRHAFEVLEEADAQKDDRFDGGAARPLGIGGLQLDARGGNPREDQFGEEAVAIGFREQRRGDGGKGKEGALGGEGGQTHWKCRRGT